ncbi:hypothetical protein NDU88_002958 [Pleurodeles waltl]|uniref:Coiled-coil domain-containing protein 136-like n=1 Tax=Pleurodeles waltl TaxID=8319 RepID=A0AAV7SEW2_PLEWA|nr:hypothetical protein NDU88_002958 [Pleurodeles waltl]
MAGLSWTPVVNNDYTEGNVSDRWVPQQQMPTDPRFTVEVVDDYDDDEPPELETEDVLVWKSGSAGECVNDICLVAQEEDDLRTQALQLLAELEETRELALKHEQSFVELQGILEDERLASAQQAEIFTKQIQNLQGQLRSVQEEIDSLEEEKESELQEVEDELKCAQEEILALRTAAEDAAAERENDIATLQEELCRLRAELVKLQQTRDEYELEITTLRAEIQMKSCGHQESEEVQLQGELQALREQCQQLRGERRSLLESNNLLRRQLHEQAEGQQLGDGSITEAEEEGRDTNDNQEEGGRETPKMESEQNEDEPRTESISAWRQGDTSLEERGLPPLLEEEEEEEVQEASCVHLEASTKVMCHKETPKTQRDDEGFGLRQQLQSAEEKVQRAQNECEGLLTEFQELQLRHRLSQEEQEKLQEELKQCREEIHRLKGSSSQEFREEETSESKNMAPRRRMSAAHQTNKAKNGPPQPLAGLSRTGCYSGPALVLVGRDLLRRSGSLRGVDATRGPRHRNSCCHPVPRPEKSTGLTIANALSALNEVYLHLQRSTNTQTCDDSHGTLPAAATRSPRTPLDACCFDSRPLGGLLARRGNSERQLVFCLNIFIDAAAGRASRHCVLCTYGREWVRACTLLPRALVKRPSAVRALRRHTTACVPRCFWTRPPRHYLPPSFSNKLGLKRLSCVRHLPRPGLYVTHALVVPYRHVLENWPVCF